MTKDQMAWIRREYPEEYEQVMDSLYAGYGQFVCRLWTVCMQVMDSLYDWPVSGLVNELLKWMPKAEFLKLVHHVGEDDGER